MHRRNRNKVLRIIREDDRWIEDEEDVIKEFEVHFSQLFISEGENEWDEVMVDIPKMVTEEMNV